MNFDLNCPQIDSAERGGSHSSSHSSPPRKHAMNTEGKGPTGTTTPWCREAKAPRPHQRCKQPSEKPTNTAKRKPRGQRPKQTKPNPEGKPRKTRQPQRVSKWARPINRKLTRDHDSNKHKSWMDKGPKRLLHMNQPTMHSINVTNLICNDPTTPRRQILGRFRNVRRATRT